MVEVFKTNINKVSVAELILQELSQYFPKSSINFDLEDCDKILRIENFIVEPKSVIHILNKNGFECEILE
jgi:hypothetical protein